MALSAGGNGTKLEPQNTKSPKSASYESWREAQRNGTARAPEKEVHRESGKRKPAKKGSGGGCFGCCGKAPAKEADSRSVPSTAASDGEEPESPWLEPAPVKALRKGEHKPNVEYDDRHAAAATRIQSVIRGKKAREQVQERLFDEPQEQPGSRRPSHVASDHHAAHASHKPPDATHASGRGRAAAGHYHAGSNYRRGGGRNRGRGHYGGRSRGEAEAVEDPPLDPESYGLGPYAEARRSAPSVLDDRRMEVRDITIKRVLSQLGHRVSQHSVMYYGFSYEQEATRFIRRMLEDPRFELPAAARAQMKEVHMFIDDAATEQFGLPDGRRASGIAGEQKVPKAAKEHAVGVNCRNNCYLLGQFDFVALPARADFDEEFKAVPFPVCCQPRPAAARPSGRGRNRAAATVAEDEVQQPKHAKGAHARNSGRRDLEEGKVQGVMMPEHDRYGGDRGHGGANGGAFGGHHGGAYGDDYGSAYGRGGDYGGGGFGYDDPYQQQWAAAQKVAKKEEPVPDCDSPKGFEGWFWVAHAAAPNIGESATADDFHAFSEEETKAAKLPPVPPPPDGEDGTALKDVTGLTPEPLIQQTPSAVCCWKSSQATTRRLKEDLYVRVMHRLWRNSLLVFGSLAVDDAVLFPFGMGAFLRHLGKCDDRYKDTGMVKRLRRKVADAMMDAICEVCFPVDKSGKKLQSRGPPTVHLCLVCLNAESIDNHNAFVSAAAAKAQTVPSITRVLQIRKNVDVLQLAHDLSKGLPSTEGSLEYVIEPSQLRPRRLKVGILNGANRKLVGNHWFQSGARFAIDENLHRRSSSMARAGLLLNMDTEPRPRDILQLRCNVWFHGGKVLRIGEDLKVHKLKVPLNKRNLKKSVAGTGHDEEVAEKRKTGKGGGGGMFACLCCQKRATAKPSQRKVAPVQATPLMEEEAGGGPHGTKAVPLEGAAADPEGRHREIPHADIRGDAASGKQPTMVTAPGQAGGHSRSARDDARQEVRPTCT